MSVDQRAQVHRCLQLNAFKWSAQWAKNSITPQVYSKSRNAFHERLIFAQEYVAGQPFQFATRWIELPDRKVQGLTEPLTIGKINAYIRAIETAKPDQVRLMQLAGLMIRCSRRDGETEWWPVTNIAMREDKFFLVIP
jgi:hypothetical protein